jgi:hypothetical protein
MAAETEEFLHLARPIAPPVPGFHHSISPIYVVIQPQVNLPPSICLVPPLTKTSMLTRPLSYV